MELFDTAAAWLDGAWDDPGIQASVGAALAPLAAGPNYQRTRDDETGREYHTYLQHGVEVLVEGRAIRAVHGVVAHPVQGRAGFSGSMLGVRLGERVEDVRARLGEPAWVRPNGQAVRYERGEAWLVLELRRGLIDCLVVERAH